MGGRKEREEGGWVERESSGNRKRASVPRPLKLSKIHVSFQFSRDRGDGRGRSRGLKVLKSYGMSGSRVGRGASEYDST